MRTPSLSISLVLILAFIAAGSAQAATPQVWFWSNERAESVADGVPDQPKGCAYKVFHSWIGMCTAPNHDMGSAVSCFGVGPRTMSETADVYLYKTFKCDLATKAWTPSTLRSAHQQAADNRGGIGGAGVWINDAAAKGKATVRVQVTGRFTALASWLGKTYEMTLQPPG